MNTLRNKLAHVPAPLGGLALGIASLGWSMENAGNFGGALQLTGALISSVLLVLLLGKIFFAHTAVFEDLRHPVVGSVLPTTAMALMIVSYAIAQYNFTIGQMLWLLGIGLHLTLLSVFIYHRAKGFNLQHMVPSWFVPPVGIIVAAVAFPGGVFEGFANALLWFGLVAYALMLPMMLYRLIFHAEVPDAAKPTIAILAAPASLSLAGYLTLTSDASPIMVAVLGGIAVAMTALIYISFLRLFRLPFSPGFSAFTFPLVIGATALFKTVTWMESLGANASLVAQIRALAHIELYVATAVVLYVSFKYLTFFAPALLPARATGQQTN
ncbi:potassium-tellurite ethidium and proflavin transporter [Pseudovibrio sp. W64]|uniref:TDT family transporter n=1 Tax=Pseudovibrio sp. W64 TaxID=1735583 RepID=UPI0007AEA092|nr:TDT family transporter [Pseudovibrio sp. W64]KZK87799.1 potassium-tellurite ethidium and proflavin transporter [Pseudovibrio sp. W64]